LTNWTTILTGGERRHVDDIFHVYPIFFIYQVFLRLREKGYEDGRLTKFEITYFILLARNHDEVSDCVDKIISYRECIEKYELEKYLKKQSKMDSRFFKVLRYIKFFSFNPEYITLKKELISPLENRVNRFNKLVENNKLIVYSEKEKAIYRNMLYSDKDLISYHKEY
jgi:hypothetical protein